VSRGIWRYMSARTRRLLTSSWAALFVLSLLMQTGALATPVATQAYVGDSVSSPFELDGNAVHQSGHDWDQVYADRNGPPYSSSGASHVIFVTDVTGQGDDILTGGSTKDTIDLSSWLWKQSSTTSVQDKDDIGNAFAAAYTAQSGHRIAYFGLDRYSISGDATAGFWFFKNGIAKTGNGGGNGTGFSGVHAEGDVLVVMDFSNGGSNGSATVYTWHNGALMNTNVSGGECDGTSQTVCATTNITDANSPWPYTPKSGTANVFPAAPIQGNSQGAGAFYEGGLDMTALGLDQSCYSSFMAETRSSNTPSSTLSDFVLGQFSFCNPPTIKTQASPSSVTIGQGTVHDTATLSGDNGPVTGNVSFFVCGPNTSDPDCSTGGTQVGSAVAISNDSATSAEFTPPGVGSYCFRAVYAPDQASSGKYLPGSHTDTDHECFSVTKAQPAITTSAAESVDVGAVIHDSAVLSGGYSPTGTITFKLYGPDDATCSAAAIYTTTATVNGNDTYGPVAYTTTAAGTYRWIASYGGDTKNSAISGQCNDTGENDVANKVTPSIATTASGSVTVGGDISDAAMVSGGYSPTGTVTFKLYGPADPSCSAAAIFTDTQPLSGGQATSAAYTTSQAGTYHWVASYSGDGNNAAVSGSCGDANESVVVNKVSPQITTSLSGGGKVGASITVPLGTAVHDTSVLSGETPDAGGTVTYTVYTDSSCSTKLQDAGVANVVNGVPGNSTDVTFDSAGTYYWQADYSGDANNSPASSACNLEQVAVQQNAPSISTFATESVVIGNTISDSAALAGGFGATGTITFNAYGPDDATCADAAVYTTSKTVNGDGIYGPVSFTPSAPGVYRWVASYSGDHDNAPVSGACNDNGENDTVVKADPAIATAASADVTVGGQISDVATVSGGFGPTGTVTFVLYGPDDATCSAPIFTSANRTLSAGHATSAAFTTSQTGTYRWIATYNGDANNHAISGDCNDANESVVVNKASPSIATTASGSVTVGGDISDTATVSGGYGPTGTVTFELYGPADQTCSADPIWTSANQPLVNGQATSGGYTTSQAGTYHWIASYSGDSNNDGVSGNCGDANESVVVNKAPTSIVTQASPGGTPGGAISDVATLSGGFQPTGSITFKLYGPETSPTCSAADLVFTSDPVAVDGNGAYPSGDFSPSTAGMYYWIASYSGDGNNLASTGSCGDQGETTVVNQFAPTITTSLASDGVQAAPSITVLFGSSVTDQATLHDASPTAGGSVTYAVYSDEACSVFYADGGTKVVTNGAVPASDPVTFPTAGIYYWMATYLGDVNDAPAKSGCGDEVVTVTTPHLTAEKLVSVNDGAPAHSTTANPGDTLTYSITVTNSGDAAATNVPVSDDITAVLAHATFESCTGGCTGPTAGVLAWTIPSIAADGGSATVSFSVTLDSSFPEGTTTLPNTVVVTGPGSNCEAESDDAACSTTTTVEAAPALSAQKEASVNGGDWTHTFSAQPGDTVSYRITITNSGDAPATDVAVSDDINALLAHATYDDDCSGGCTLTDGVLSWTVASIPANGGSAVLTFSVTLSSTFPVGVTTLPNTVVVEGSNCPPESDDPLCTTTGGFNQPALTIEKSFTGNTADPLVVGGVSYPQAKIGDTLTYTLTYAIDSPPAHDGVITDVLPAGQTYVTGSATGNDEFTFQSYDSATRTLTWTAPEVTTGDSVTYQVTIDTGADALAQPLTNTATIKSDETPPDSATADIYVAPPPQEVTQPPTDALPSRQQPANPGFSLMLLLLGLAGFALALGFVTPVPERARRRDRD
jgi:uncharacterized repeat protein (TIGR01451 family)/fimbrial isopeptide formation D2 family protein